MPRLEGKIAVVTGASSGIGLATAKTFLDEGASKVYITGRRKVELDAAGALLGGRVVGVQGDVTNRADLDELYDRVRTDAGRVDIVFANAGFAAPAPLGSLTDDHIDALLNTNVKGVIWTVQKALPLMEAGGSIILSASIVASKGFGDWSIYSASKAAVRSFARTWSSDLKGRNIRVNAVSPGVINTPAWTETGLPQEQVSGFFDFAASITPLGRTGRDEEVARVVAFLASDESSFMNGSEVFIDGGLTQVSRAIFLIRNRTRIDPACDRRSLIGGRIHHDLSPGVATPRCHGHPTRRAGWPWDSFYFAASSSCSAMRLTSSSDL